MPSSVSLGTQLESAVQQLVDSGRYQSKSEVIREGVRLVEEREKRLALLDAALERGIADADARRVFAGEDVFADLERRYRGTAESSSE
jgi:antitoxin ParD1/3/4